MAAKKWRIVNYGNVRSIYINGQTWESPKNGTIYTTDKEVADEFAKMFAIDVDVIEQPEPEKEIVKKEIVKKKKKVARKKKAVKKKKVAKRKKAKHKKRRRKVA